MPKFHVERSIQIDVACQRVFDAVSDFNTWTTWSPWLLAEPDAEVIVSGDGKAVGAGYSWNGDVTGAGEMEHLSLDEPVRVEDEIRFLRPMKSVSRVSFDLKPTGDATHVTWNMDGSLPWFLFWMTGMMDGFIGNDYERGLKMLKEWLETGSISSRVDVSGAKSMDSLRVIGARRQCAMQDVGESMDKAMVDAKSKMEAASIPTDGDMIAVYHKSDFKAKTFDYTIGFSVPKSVMAPAELNLWDLPNCDAFHVSHTGSYDHLGNGWSAAMQHVRYKKMKMRKDGCFEIYRNLPDNTPPSELVTDIYIALK